MTRQVNTDDYRGDDRREYSRWHIDRSINIATVIAILSLAGALAAGWNQLDQRITTNSTYISNLKQDNMRQDHRVDRIETRTQQLLDSINNKIDRLLEDKANGH